MTTTVDRPVRTGEAGHKGLQTGAIGLVTSTVIAVSSVAPAYSLAAALGLIIVTVGFHAPGVVLLSFVPMALVAQGYNRLNRELPDCGTTFTWGRRTFGPSIGWLGGWGIVVCDVVLLSNLGQIAGQYFFSLVGAHGLAAERTGWVTVAGVGWIVVMTAICYLGIEISARVQYALLSIEITMLFVFGITALVKVYAGSAPAADPADAGMAAAGPHHVALSWFNPLSGSLSALTIGMLATLFIYWGFDTAVAVNEETRDADRTPGRAALLATVILLATHVLVSTAADAFAGLGSHGIGLANSDNVSDVLSVLGPAVFGTSGAGLVFSKLLVLMILSSAAACTLTSILPMARTTLSMGAQGAIPARFARVHDRFKTPTWSTIGLGAISAALYVAFSYLNGGRVLTDLIAALGLPIAFYYALTGWECVRWFAGRRQPGLRELWATGLGPGIGAAALTFFFGYGCYHYWQAANGTTTWLVPGVGWRIGGVVLCGAGSIALGVALLVAWRAVHPRYFTDGRPPLDAAAPVPTEALPGTLGR